MEILAIIPARGGSKGIPKKNIAPLAGYPLIAYAIASGIASVYVDRVIVSTDDTEIADVARTYETEVVRRPKMLAEDNTRDYPVVKHVLDTLHARDTYTPDVIVFLRPTSPIRPKGFVDAGIQCYLKNQKHWSSLRAVCRSPITPYKMWHLRGDCLVPVVSDPEYPEAYNAPRQELPTTYWQTGHLDVYSLNSLKTHRSVTGPYIGMFPIEGKYVVDIDTPENLKKAESQLRLFSTEQIDYPNNMPGICPNCLNHITKCMGCTQNCADWQKEDSSVEKRNHGGGVLNDPSDAFSRFQISERRAAKRAEKRTLTAEQAAEIECTAEWRNALEPEISKIQGNRIQCRSKTKKSESAIQPTSSLR